MIFVLTCPSTANGASPSWQDFDALAPYYTESIVLPEDGRAGPVS
jgi:hypothetical protein